MDAAGAAVGAPARPRSYADLVAQTPQPIPEVEVPLRPLKMFEGVPYVSFTKEEIDRSAQPFKFFLVLKFLRRRPSLDNIRAFCWWHWGLVFQPVISAMANPRSVFVCLSNEEDFIKGFSREAFEIDGVPYRVFHWSPEYVEEQELAFVPVWIFLLGLPPNYYHESFLRNITLPLGQFIRRDNCTRCATRTDGARVCIKMDISKPPMDEFWIGVPNQPSSWLQAVVFEKLPQFCMHCCMQGHNLKMCSRERTKIQGGDGKLRKIWGRKDKKIDGKAGCSKEVGTSEVQPT
ncbi:uncharacterized protein LOC122274703 [Carya illinoinensis]|uniref:uncharacterized protein LOC122274703 n=1 Tax=Carya illinoinensis TaxID=32201 RepID=UPI001C71BB7A|nr:uncharacterized protein LOC122274703 [Carya illinoinensis]